MHRHFSATCITLLAVCFAAAPAFAGDDEALKEEVKQLRLKVDALQGQQTALVESEVEKYLESTTWAGAQGGSDAIDVTANFTTVFQATLGLDPNDRSVVGGDVDLNFHRTVTENLDLFIKLTANASESSDTRSLSGGISSFASPATGAFPDLFGPDFFDGGSFGTGYSWGSIAGPTFSGLSDGIGVNGTRPTDPGSITVYEATIYHRLAVSDNTLHWEIGAMDPRTRFLQTAFADNENTQFINNLFDDSPSILWATDGSGRTVYGIHMWLSFGGNKQYTINWGWFNKPGQFFNMGQFYFQFHWKGEVNGREMNIRLMGFIDEMFRDSTPSTDGSAGGGATWDWMVTDQIGLFFRIATNGGDVNPVELDASVGAQMTGLIGSRPDDVIGIAVGFITANDTVLVGIPEDTEFTLELYYKYVMEDGKMQITPHLIYVSDPGGNASPWQDDALFILGLRIHVPF